MSGSVARATCRRLPLACLVVLLTACPQKTAVWISRGATAANLVFHFGKEPGKEAPVAVGGVHVRTCADSVGGYSDTAAMWAMYALDHARMLSAVQYGGVPDGFRSTVGPVALQQGCYFVEISGTGRTRFAVRSDDSVVDEGRPW
jgi:hypothetical protein